MVSSSTTVFVPTNATSTVYTEAVTTLSPDLRLHDMKTIYLLAMTLGSCVGAILLCCLLKGIVTYRRDKKVTDNQVNEMHEISHTDTNDKGNGDEDNDDDDDEDFQHPAPSAPRTSMFKGVAIAGPFGQPQMDDQEDLRAEVVTPSFINTSVVDNSGGTRTPRYTYIP